MNSTRHSNVSNYTLKRRAFLMFGVLLFVVCAVSLYMASGDRIAGIIRNHRNAEIKELRIYSAGSERALRQVDAVEYIESKLADGVIKPHYELVVEIGSGERVTYVIVYADGWEESKDGLLSEHGMSLFLPSVFDVRVTLSGVYFLDPDVAEVVFDKDAPQSLLECVSWAENPM